MWENRLPNLPPLRALTHNRQNTRQGHEIFQVKKVTEAAMPSWDQNRNEGQLDGPSRPSHPRENPGSSLVSDDKRQKVSATSSENPLDFRNRGSAKESIPAAEENRGAPLTD